MRLQALAEKTGKPVATRSDVHKYKYEFVLTNDEAAVGYSSSFVLIKSDPMWGFHLVWINVQGKPRSTTIGFRVKLGNTEARDFGMKFLRTFNTVSERLTKREHMLGQIEALEGHPKHTVQELFGVLLAGIYDKMWDLDVVTSQFEDIPRDVLDDFEAFVD